MAMVFRDASERVELTPAILAVMLATLRAMRFAAMPAAWLSSRMVGADGLEPPTLSV